MKKPQTYKNRDGAFLMKTKQNSDIFSFEFQETNWKSFEKNSHLKLSPVQCGEKFSKFYGKISQKFNIKRLVLTAPIDTYKGYRKWLISLCEELPVEEVAVVDEPTAAALGIKIAYGENNDYRY